MRFFVFLVENYSYLVNGEAVRVVEEFMADPEHEFKDYTTVRSAQMSRIILYRFKIAMFIGNSEV